MRPVARALIAALTLASCLGGPRPASAHHYHPIQPGAEVATPTGSSCTLNFVFADPDGDLYVGTAGHCAGPPGTPALIHGGGRFGSVAYRADTPERATPMKDFALIAIDRDKHGWVDPSVRAWGGPAGVERTFLPGTPLLVYGHGVGVGASEPTRARTGVLTVVYDGALAPLRPEYEGYFIAQYAATSGDSGGPVLTADGRALGVTTTRPLLGGEPGLAAGPTLQMIEQDLAAAGLEVALVTAPIRVGSDGARDLLDHCAAEPTGGTSESCLGL